ncbi:MAG TPA: DNRLRE domain-containing protein [Anaerohalosphaeraceae bacterium]|nr:DNRLRE domain-containing protein [Anaerohalosphaeraceae bacterium]
MRKFLFLLAIVVCSNFAATAYSVTTYYDVWRNTTDDPTTATRIKQWLTSTDCNDDDPSLVPGLPYYYWVRALVCDQAEVEGYLGLSNLYIHLKMICPIYATNDCNSPVFLYAKFRGDHFGDTSKRVTFGLHDRDSFLNDTIDSWTWPISFEGAGFEQEWYKDVDIANYADWGQAELFFDAAPFLAHTQPDIIVTVQDTPVSGPTSYASSGTYTDKIHLTWDPTTDICSEIDVTPSCQGWTKRTFTVTAECDPGMGYVVPNSIQVLEGDSATFTAYPNGGYDIYAWYLCSEFYEEIFDEQYGGLTYTISSVNRNFAVWAEFYPNPGSTTVTLNPIADATIYSLSPEGNTNSNGFSEIHISLNHSTLGTCYGLIKFNLDDIPSGSTINSARIELNCLLNDGIDDMINVCGSSWSINSVCWNNRPNFGTVNLFSQSSGVGTWIWQSSAFNNVVSSWISNPTTNYGLYIVSNSAGSRAAFSSSCSTVSSSLRPKLIVTYTPPPADTSPPTPNPMTWETQPYTDGTSSITMVAGTANDSSGVEYYFDETSGNSGGSDSGWQNSRTYTDTELQHGTTYTYRVKARDKSVNHNETSYSSSKSAVTIAVGSLTISITPQAAVDAGAKWCTDRDPAWQSSGDTISGLTVGDYTIQFNDIPGFSEPAPQPIAISVGSNFVNYDYQRIYSGGSGIAGNPFIIADTNDLIAMGNNPASWNSYFILTNDIDLTGWIFATALISPDHIPFEYEFQGDAFTGVFDGNGHKITGITINGGMLRDYIGLFGYIGTGGEVKNLGIEGCFINGDNYVGGIAGANLGDLSNCYTSGFVNGDFTVGGLVGWNESGGIDQCYSTSNVTAQSDDGGGLVGYNYNGSIVKSFAASKVSGVDSIGGFVGGNIGTIENCYSTGMVKCTGSYAGGLAARNGGFILNCYSTSDVNGIEYAGGLIGYVSVEAVVSQCFWDTENQSNGTIQSIGSDDGGTIINVSGLNTSQMQTQAVYTAANWDFSDSDGDSDDWKIRTGFGYPLLSWQKYLTGDFAGDYSVNLIDFSVLAASWGSQLGDLNYDPNCNIDDSGESENIIDMADLIIFCENWLVGTYTFEPYVIYYDDFRDVLTWTVSNSSVYIKDNDYLYISADGAWDNGSAEKTFDINLTPDKQIIIEQRVKLESGGENYRLPGQSVYFDDSSGLSVTYLPSEQGQSYGWHFLDWTGINQPEVKGEDYWTIIRLVITSTGGELHMKPDDAEKGWFSGNFSFIASANWSHSKISKIKFTQPWDSVNCIDYITIKSE